LKKKELNIILTAIMTDSTHKNEEGKVIKMIITKKRLRTFVIIMILMFGLVLLSFDAAQASQCDGMCVDGVQCAENSLDSEPKRTESCESGSKCAYYGCLANCGDSKDSCACGCSEAVGGDSEENEKGEENENQHIEQEIAKAETNIPLDMFHTEGQSTWTVTNLILTVFGIIAPILFLVVAGKRYEDEYTKAKINKKSCVCAHAFSIPAAVLLVLTQNFTGSIVFFDWFTIAHIIIFATILVFCQRIHSERRKEK